MSTWVVASEGFLRAVAFVVTFAAMAAVETLFEARPLRVRRVVRWKRNLALTALNTIVLRLLFPFGATAAAGWASARDLGLLRQLSLPAGAEIVIAIALLDLVVYGQHRLFHAVPALFRFHQIGMAEHQSTLDQTVRWMLALPFRRKHARQISPARTQQEAA